MPGHTNCCCLHHVASPCIAPPSSGGYLGACSSQSSVYNSAYSRHAAPSPAQCACINQTSRGFGVQRQCVTSGCALTTEEGQWDPLGSPLAAEYSWYALLLWPVHTNFYAHLPTPVIPDLPSATGPNLTRPLQHTRNSPMQLDTKLEEPVHEHFAVIAEHLPHLGPGRVGLTLLPYRL